MIVFNYGHI